MWNYHCAVEVKFYNDTTDPQVFLQVSAVHLIKEKNCKQSHFCKVVSKVLETVTFAQNFKHHPVVHYLHITEKGYSSLHSLYFIQELACLCDQSSSEIIFVIKNMVLSFILLVKQLLLVDVL